MTSSCAAGGNRRRGESDSAPGTRGLFFYDLYTTTINRGTGLTVLTAEPNYAPASTSLKVKVASPDKARGPRSSVAFHGLRLVQM